MGHRLQPMFFGRLLRVLAGVAFLIPIPFVPRFEHAWLAIAGLVLAALTFLAAGLTANPGCEITALPNLFLPPARRPLDGWPARVRRRPPVKRDSPGPFWGFQPH